MLRLQDTKFSLCSGQRRLLAAVCLSLLYCTSVCSAQIVWQLTDSNTTERNKTITSVACSGLRCIASGILDAKTSPYKTTLIFLISSDGGLTWQARLAPIEPIFGHGHVIHQVFLVDSMNGFAVGDTSLILRTSDGGTSWIRQNCPASTLVTTVHFADPQNGIALGRGPSVILTTSDGGENWIAHTADSAITYSSCFCRAASVYSVFVYGSGPIISTNDGWMTSDTSNSLPFTVEGSDDARVYVGCEFFGQDTAVAYGNRLIVRDSLIAKQISTVSLTADGGRTWASAVDDSSIRTLTSAIHYGDTVVVSSQRTGDRLLLSSNRGLSWHSDSLLLPNVGINSVNGIARTSVGSYVGHFGQFLYNGPYLGVGVRATSIVERDAHVPNGGAFYPNPARSVLHIHSTEPRCSCQLADAFGRVLVTINLDPNGNGTIDLSDVPSGCYLPMIRQVGTFTPFAPVLVVK